MTKHDGILSSSVSRFYLFACFHGFVSLGLALYVTRVLASGSASGSAERHFADMAQSVLLLLHLPFWVAWTTFLRHNLPPEAKWIFLIGNSALYGLIISAVVGWGRAYGWRAHRDQQNGEQVNRNWDSDHHDRLNP